MKKHKRRPPRVDVARAAETLLLAGMADEAVTLLKAAFTDSNDLRKALVEASGGMA